jgi:hypothetical protein
MFAVAVKYILRIKRKTKGKTICLASSSVPMPVPCITKFKAAETQIKMAGDEMTIWISVHPKKMKKKV